MCYGTMVALIESDLNRELGIDTNVRLLAEVTLAA